MPLLAADLAGRLMHTPRLIERLTDMTEQLAHLVTVCERIERGDSDVNVIGLRAALEHAHAHATELTEDATDAETAHQESVAKLMEGLRRTAERWEREGRG
jgi:hypothetical protein